MKKIDGIKESDRVVRFLLAEMEKRKISPYEISKGTELSYTSVLDILKLKNKPAYYTLYIIADYLGFEIKMLMKQSEDLESSIPEE